MHRRVVAAEQRRTEADDGLEHPTRNQHPRSFDEGAQPSIVIQRVVDGDLSSVSVKCTFQRLSRQATVTSHDGCRGTRDEYCSPGVSRTRAEIDDPV